MKKIFTLLIAFVMLPLAVWATVTPTDGSTTTLGTDPISITSAGIYTITGTYSGTYSGNIINVNASGQDVTLVLDGVTIENNNANLTGRWYALNIGTGTEVTLALKGENKLISGGYAGIHVPNGATLTIKEDDNNPGGSLEAKSIKTNSSSVGCGIGSNTYAAAGTDAGKIIIESGTVTATTECAGAPGIGGWYSFESIEIKGGAVTATGASDTGGKYGPGIGLSSMASTTYNENKSGDIKISGGTVVATGGNAAAGIGCGNAKNNEYLNIIIEGDAHVTAKGGDKAAGIGGSYVGNTSETITKVNVTIQGNATVIATGGSGLNGLNGGAGIGGAYDSKNGGEIKILGNASVTATGGNRTNGYGGAGIGAGGKNSDFESIEINTTGTVKATAVADASGIGGAAYTPVTGTITIENGTIEATGAGYGYPGIGKNSTTTIKGPAYITAKGGDSADEGIDETTLTIEDNSNAVIVTDGITPGENWNGVLVIDTKENTGTIYGDEVEVKQEIEIPEDVTLTIKDGQTLKGGDNITNKGEIINNGTIDGNINNDDDGTVKSKIKQDDIKVTVEEKEYDGEAPKVTVTVDGEDASSGTFIVVSYTYYKSDGTKLVGAPTDAGSYKVTVTVKGTGTAGEDGYAYTDAEVTSAAVEFTIKQTSAEDPEEPEEPDTPVIPDMPEYYNIIVDECEGVTVETSSTVVREGQSMTFTVDIAEGYTDENMTVKVKRSLFGYTEVIEPNNEGIYEIKNIYTDIYLTIDGVEEEEETPTGMEDIEGAKVYAKDGSIYVQTSKQEQVQIISISGAVLKNETQIGLKRYDLPRGIYIIGIGEQRFKVRN